MCTYTHPQSHTHSRFPVVGQIGTSRLVQNKSLNFSPSQPLPSHPPSVSHFHPLARFPASESLLMLILITPHIQADKKSKWLISSNTPESAHLLLYPSLPAFFQSNSQVPPEKCEPEIFFFYSALPSLPSIVNIMLRTKSEFLTLVLRGPTRHIRFVPVSSLLSLSILLVMLQSSWLSCYSSDVQRFFYYRTFALLFLLHEYISLT